MRRTRRRACEGKSPGVTCRRVTAGTRGKLERAFEAGAALFSGALMGIGLPLAVRAGGSRLGGNRSGLTERERGSSFVCFSGIGSAGRLLLRPCAFVRFVGRMLADGRGRPQCAGRVWLRWFRHAT